MSAQAGFTIDFTAHIDDIGTLTAGFGYTFEYIANDDCVAGTTSIKHTSRSRSAWPYEPGTVNPRPVRGPDGGSRALRGGRGLRPQRPAGARPGQSRGDRRRGHPRGVGQPFLSYAAPYSDRELRAALDRVDPDRLSDEGRAKYDAALAALRPDPGYRSGRLGASASVVADLDVNWRSDESVPWVQGYQERPSFLALPLEAWAGEGVYGFSELALRRDYWSINLPVADLSMPNVTSVPIDFIGCDGNFPFRAFGAAGGDFWSFRAGRDRLSLGSMGEDNLVVSSKTKWYDYARLTLFFRDFQYSAYMVQLDTERNLYMHRLDFLFFDRLSVGLTKGLLVGQAPPELRFFNPLMIYHGYEAWNGETIATGDATTGGVKRRRRPPASAPCSASSSTAIPRATSPSSRSTSSTRAATRSRCCVARRDERIPNSAAYLLGAKLRAPWHGGYLKGELCGVYSEPFDMILANDDISFIYRRHANSGYSSAPIEEWIGFSEGPDCIRLFADNVSDVIWTMEFSGRGSYPSPSSERVLGYTPEEAMQHTLHDILVPSSRPGPKGLQRSRRGGKVWPSHPAGKHGTPADPQRRVDRMDRSQL